MSQPAEQAVLTSIDGHVGRIVLNRPKSINAIDHRMVELIASALAAWITDDRVRAVVISGAGDRGLCAGGDIVAMHSDAKALAGTADDVAAAESGSGVFWFDEYRMNAAIDEYPKPVVAIMDGIVMGGGVGVSGHASIRIATDRTRLAMPETGIGLVPDVGGTWLLANVPDQLGVYAGLTSQHLTGADAVAMGLATHYVPADRLDALQAELAHRAPGDVLAELAIDPPAANVDANRGWIATAFAADTVGEIVANCRALGTDEATTVADKIERVSPMAATVALAAFRAAAGEAGLRQALIREFRTSLRCLQYPDLAEGIRAQVIDKDRNPAWQASSLDQVTAADAAAFVAPLPDGRELTFTD